MEKSFDSLLTAFIGANGREILDNPDRFKSVFLDYSRNEHNAELKIFKQLLDSNFAREIKTHENVDTLFLSSVAERFHQTFLFDKKVCELMVFAYARSLGLTKNNPFENKNSAADKARELPVFCPR